MSNAKDVIEILIGLWANIIATASFIVAVKKQKNTATENPHNKKTVTVAKVGGRQTARRRK